MSVPTFDASMSEETVVFEPEFEDTSTFDASMTEHTIVYETEFEDYIILWRGMVRAWIGDGVEGAQGILYAEIFDGVIQTLGPVTGYYYALQAGFQGSYLEWVQVILEGTNNAMIAQQGALAATASAEQSQLWASGGSSGTYTEGNSAKEKAQAAANSATSSNNAKVAAQSAQTAAETAQNKAETAQTKAETAQTKAETAQTKAETAQTKAETAQSKAEQAQGYAESAQSAAESARSTAQSKASDAEAWAVGTRGGTAVPSTDTTYHNNSKYYAQEAQAIYESVAIVTPEQFGAAGDGVADDTQAIQDAINYAVAHQASVRGFQQYKTTQSLTVSTSFLDMYIRSITYSGNDCAISVTGSYNKLEFGLLYCASGKGIVMRRVSSNTSCAWNKIICMRLYAYGHGVHFDTAGSNFILYNTFDIRVIKSDSGNCFNGDDFVSENVYMNTTCFCPNAGSWAIYRCGGRFYNFTLESQVYNGIYVTSGSCYWSGFRHREMTDKMIRYINGLIEYNGGILLKYVGADYAVTRWIGDDAIPYKSIDVSEMCTPEGLIAEYNAASTVEERRAASDKMGRMSYFQQIDAPITIGNWDTSYGYVKIGSKMYIHGGRKICVPLEDSEYRFFADYDMRDAQYDHAITCMPFSTKFIPADANLNIYLSASYNPEGYREFIVDQQSYFCNVYDYNDSTTPIFNGASYGYGVYKFTAYTLVGQSCVNKVDPSKHINFFDSSNYTWVITKISPSNGVVNVSDYGAVGDGVTDDTSAIIAATARNSEVYFESNKTYLVTRTVEITHDVKLHGGENTVIKTQTPSGGVVPNCIIVNGTLKTTTTLTSDYSGLSIDSTSDNNFNKITLTDMSEVEIGDILVIQASDQFYSYARQYYYLGAALLVTDVYDGHAYVNVPMPFDIENTANVSVKVYSAPKVSFENLNFVSDLNSGSSGAYVYCLTLNRCRMPEVRNCTFTDTNNGILLQNCVGTTLENVSVAKMQRTNESYDSYGVALYTCTETTIRKLLSTAARSAINISGSMPTINTFIKECDLYAEARSSGLGMHESVYNTVIEDCVIAGATLYGTVDINRCEFVQNSRLAELSAVSFRGSHNPDFARIRIRNSKFPPGNSIALVLREPAPQTPRQSFNNIIGSVEIENCYGGRLQYTPTVTATILSNTIQRITINNWRDCYDIYHTHGNVIDTFIVNNSNFIHPVWLNSHTNTFDTTDIKFFEVNNSYPQEHVINVNETGNCTYYLPKDVDISFTSSDSSAKYFICGENIASNKISELNVGTVGGAAGSPITFTPNAAFENALSLDSSGNLVYTQPNAYSNAGIYPLHMVYVKDRSVIKTSVKLANTGSTDGASFRIYLAIVDAATGNVRYRGDGQSGTATVSGITLTHTRDVLANSFVFSYVQCYSTYPYAETTISNYVTKILPGSMSNTSISYMPYESTSRTGTGILKSLEGQNNIIVDSSSTVAVSFNANMLHGL